MPRELTLRIVIEDAPPGVDYALQRGKGGAHETEQTQRSTGADLSFEFQPQVKDGVFEVMSALRGPYIQGTAKKRFIYIDIGTYAGQADSCWSRKLKVPLDGITSHMIMNGGILEARIPGTGRDGGPTCATVRDFDGWKPVRGTKR